MALARRILIIDQDPSFRRSAAQVLSAAGFQVLEAASGRAGLAELGHWMPDGVVVDLDLDDVDAVQLVRAVMSDAAPRPSLVCVTDRADVARIVEVMRLGARDVLTKPADHNRLRDAVMNAVERGELASDVGKLQRGLVAADSGYALVHESTAMRHVIDRVERLAGVEMPVLILGEAGVGKGTVARRLHAKGPRANKPFVVVPAHDEPAATEAALFGTSGRPSAFAQAQDGVLFIESIVSLGFNGQTRLARVLADLNAARTSGQPVTCPRLVVAAERDLSELVEAGAVNEELARRLSPLTLVVPSLRDRRADIAEMARSMAAQAAATSHEPKVELSPELLNELSGQSWPGNLRELNAAVMRAVALARNGQVRVEDFRGPRGASAVQAAPQASARGWSPRTDAEGEVQRYDDYEAEIFRFALEKAGGCVSRAAEMLGVGRATMYRKMRSYDIDAPPVSERAISRAGKKTRSGPDEQTA